MNQNVANYADHVNELLLYNCLRGLFPNHDIKVNEKKDHNLKYLDSGKQLEYDIWIPSLNLCIEFQDSYHYVTTWYKQTPQQRILEKDYLKRELVSQQGTSIVLIPCWWEGTALSLASTIHYYRPDLLYGTCSALIPLNPEATYFDVPELPNASELMLASFTQEHFKATPHDWWIGEKYDGVRCYWDPYSRTPYSRHGRVIALLPSMLPHAPTIAIDCELWYGRGNFNMSKYLTAASANFFWDFFRAPTFDVVVDGVPFEERYALILEKVNVNNALFVLAFRVLCESDAHTKATSQEIITEGGEGIILRRIKTQYEHGRSKLLLKWKTAMGDQEAMVVDVGLEGSLSLQLPNGKTFSVPPKDVQIPTPAIGDVVSFSFDTTARRDVPINPIVFRNRTDIVWEDLVNSTSSQVSHAGYKSKPLHYWSIANVRKHLEEYAYSLGLDPLQASTWSTISAADIQEMEGGSGLLATFKGGFHAGIQSVFPELDFTQRDYLDNVSVWQDSNLRRDFFVRYAHKRGGDPLNPTFWYAQSKENIYREKGGPSVLQHHDYKLRKALTFLFPEIGFDNSKFKSLSSWREKKTRRAVFENFAKANYFDPLVPENWDKVKTRMLYSFPGGGTVIKNHYGSSIRKALLDLFPEIGLSPLQKDKRYREPRNSLLKMPGGIHKWKLQNKRRAFFDDFAESKGADPLFPNFWYSVTPQELMQFKSGYSSIAVYYGYKLPTILMQLYPEIGLQESNFKHVHSWKQEQDRRSYFDSFAESKGMDPLNPEFWYGVAVQDLKLFRKGYASIAKTYGQNLPSILMRLYPSVGLKISGFKKSMWKDREKRKAALLLVATKQHFDYLQPTNWYKLSWKEFCSVEATRLMIKNYYRRSYIAALMDLLPELNLDPTKFLFIPLKHWEDRLNRRELFCNIAHERGFDPLVPANWYSVFSASLRMAAKGVKYVLDTYYNGSYSKAVIDLFPEIGLVPENFKLVDRTQRHEGKRWYLETFAKKQGFDPLTPEGWVSFLFFSQRLSSTTDNMLTQRLLNKYTSIAEALAAYFPEMQHELSDFPILNSKCTLYEASKKIM